MLKQLKTDFLHKIKFLLPKEQSYLNLPLSLHLPIYVSTIKYIDEYGNLSYFNGSSGFKPDNIDQLPLEALNEILQELERNQNIVQKQS